MPKLNLLRHMIKGYRYLDEGNWKSLDQQEEIEKIIKDDMKESYPKLMNIVRSLKEKLPYLTLSGPRHAIIALLREMGLKFMVRQSST